MRYYYEIELLTEGEGKERRYKGTGLFVAEDNKSAKKHAKKVLLPYYEKWVKLHDGLLMITKKVLVLEVFCADHNHKSVLRITN